MTLLSIQAFSCAGLVFRYSTYLIQPESAIPPSLPLQGPQQKRYHHLASRRLRRCAISPRSVSIPLRGQAFAAIPTKRNLQILPMCAQTCKFMLLSSLLNRRCIVLLTPHQFRALNVSLLDTALNLFSVARCYARYTKPVRVSHTYIPSS